MITMKTTSETEPLKLQSKNVTNVSLPWAMG